MNNAEKISNKIKELKAAEANSANPPEVEDSPPVVTPAELKTPIVAPEEDNNSGLDWTIAKDRITAIEAFQAKFVGKPEHNPFLWMKQNLWPLKQAMANGDRSAELYKLIMKLKEIVPVGDHLKIQTFNLRRVLNEKGVMVFPKGES